MSVILVYSETSGFFILKAATRAAAWETRFLKWSTLRRTVMPASLAAMKALSAAKTNSRVA